MPAEPYQCTLMNPRTAQPVCEEVRIAQTFFSRLIGLLGKRELRHGQGLWLRPSSGIHTLFMTFPIDVIAFDRHGTVLKTIQPLRPWRIAVVPRKTRSVLELPAGHLSRNPITIGEQAWPTYA